MLSHMFCNHEGRKTPQAKLRQRFVRSYPASTTATQLLHSTAELGSKVLRAAITLLGAGATLFTVFFSIKAGFHTDFGIIKYQRAGNYSLFLMRFTFNFYMLHSLELTPCQLFLSTRSSGFPVCWYLEIIAYIHE